MKKMLYILILLLIFVSACNKNKTDIEEQNSKYKTESIFEEIDEFKIIQGPCGTIEYVDKIGTDFQSAEDSLLKIISLPNSGCPDNPCSEYNLNVEKITVDFTFDNRAFYAIIFKDTLNYMTLSSPSEVLDDRGNHYKIGWCPD